MAFNKQAPGWGAIGIEPPESKRIAGWEVEDRPPAAWLNWFMNLTAESLQELQTKAAEKTYVDEQIAEAIEGIETNIPDASLTVKGISKLSSEVNSTSERDSATPKAVKIVNDSLITHTVDNLSHLTAVERAGWNAKATTQYVDTRDGDTLGYAQAYIDAKVWQKTKLTGDDGKCILLATGTNLNSVFRNGFYNGNGLVNAPGPDWFYIEVLEHTSGDAYAIQKAYNFYSHSFYMRNMQGGVWSAWSDDLFQSGVNAKSAVVAAVNAKGVATTVSDTWSVVANKIEQIPTGKKTLEGVITGLTMNNLGNYQFNLTTQPQVNSLGFTPKMVFLRLMYLSGSGSTEIIGDAHYDFCYGAFPNSFSNVNKTLYNINEGGFNTDYGKPGEVSFDYKKPSATININMIPNGFVIVNLKYFSQFSHNVDQNAKCSIHWVAVG